MQAHPPREFGLAGAAASGHHAEQQQGDHADGADMAAIDVGENAGLLAVLRLDLRADPKRVAAGDEVARGGVREGRGRAAGELLRGLGGGGQALDRERVGGRVRVGCQHQGIGRVVGAQLHGIGGLRVPDLDLDRLPGLRALIRVVARVNEHEHLAVGHCQREADLLGWRHDVRDAEEVLRREVVALELGDRRGDIVAGGWGDCLRQADGSWGCSGRGRQGGSGGGTLRKGCRRDHEREQRGESDQERTCAAMQHWSLLVVAFGLAVVSAIRTVNLLL